MDRAQWSRPLYGTFRTITPGSARDQIGDARAHWLEPIYMRVGYMLLNRVIRQEWFNRFPWFLAALTKSGRILKKMLFNFLQV